MLTPDPKPNCGTRNIINGTFRVFSHFLRKLGSINGKPNETIAVGGLVWRVEPAGVVLFGGNGPALGEWESAGLKELVKQNLQRQIFRVQLPGGSIYVKRCRANTPRSWAREVLRPAKARLEFENARALRSLGIDAIEPLAWGGVPGPFPGDSYLITRARDTAMPFVEFLEAANSPADRRQIARGFARFMARIHDAGIAHPDPHPGNFLVEWSPSRLPQFVLTDLHAIRFGKPLDWPATRANLILLNRWFQVRASRTDRLRFWRTYLDARVSCAGEKKERARDLEAATEASNHRFWADRCSRYLSNNSDSHAVRGRNIAGFAIRELPDEILRAWFADPDGPFAGAKILKDSRSSTVAEFSIETSAGPRVVIFKRLNLKSPIGVVKNLFRSSPALRSWVMGNSVRDRGLPTARPLAVWHRTRLRIPLTGYAVFDKVPEAVGLPEAIAAITPLAPDYRRRVLWAWADRIGYLVRRMHERQISHRDLKAPNVLMSGTDSLLAEPILIDLVGVEVSRVIPRVERVRNLARLNASFQDSRTVSRTDRLRCLRTYLGWGLRGHGDWKKWWNQINEATRAKVRLNTRRGRPLA